jgi:hypothetical protein
MPPSVAVGAHDGPAEAIALACMSENQLGESS